MAAMTQAATTYDTITGIGVMDTVAEPDSIYYNYLSKKVTTGTLTPGANSLAKAAINNYPGLERIRVRTTILPYTNGASDTNAYFKQYIIRR